MTTMNATMDVSANRPPAKTGSRPNKMGSVNSLTIEHVKKIFGVKPWGPLARLLGVDDRTAQHRVYGTRSFDSDELAVLLWQENGFQLLTAIMEKAPRKPLWWRICRPLMRTAELDRARLLERREVEAMLVEALGNDAKHAAAIEAGRSALALQDSEFYRPHAAAVLAAARPQGSALAPVKRGRR
jgi:hypothetical protein